VPDWCQIGAMVFYMHVAGKMACHSPENRFFDPLEMVYGFQIGWQRLPKPGQQLDGGVVLEKLSNTITDTVCSAVLRSNFCQSS